MKLLVALVIALVSLTVGQDTKGPMEIYPGEKYPERWYQLDIKAVIDNDRLFYKYKNCYISDSNVGCPRDAMEVKKYAPEIIDTLCSKCTPEHIEAGRLAINYTCLTRRKDYDDVKNYYDPDGSILKRAEEKYGKLSCE